MKTMETIYEEMKALYASTSGTAPADGGDLTLRLYTAAAQLYALWEQAAFVSRQSFPQTAVGEALDNHAEIRGLSRNPGVQAVGTLRFAVDQAASRSIAIPEGTTCTDDAGTAFVTTEAGSIPAGSLSCDVAARAVEPGPGGNAPADSVIYMVLPPAGVVSCTNPTAFSDGTAAESDDALRQRVLASYQRLPNGANKAYYESQALSVPGVAGVSVLPKNRGVGTVDVYITSESGTPSQALIAAVQKKLEEQREICVDLKVISPSIKTVTVKASITVKPNYDADAVCEAVEAAISGYFTGHRLGENILRSKLGNLIYEVEGVENYSLTQPSSDISVTASYLPILSSLQITKVE